mmetsp:Transcript_12783/g.32699  ORF Transcript_12783/g.32699 Transcript_12783/m.32699 type:complete len:222 (+) Transcript_12783:287-952(+)
MLSSRTVNRRYCRPYPVPQSTLADAAREGAHRGAVDVLEVLRLLDDLVNDAVLESLLRVHVLDAVRIGRELLQRDTRCLRHDRERLPAVREDLASLDRNVRRLATGARLGLVEHDRTVWQCRPFALLPAREQHRCEPVRLADEHRVDGSRNIVHSVSNREGLCLEADRLTVRGLRTRRVNVHQHGLLGPFVLQVQQLGDDELRHLRDNRHAQVDDAVVEQQ